MRELQSNALKKEVNVNLQIRRSCIYITLLAVVPAASIAARSPAPGAIFCLLHLSQIAEQDEPSSTDSVPHTLSHRVGQEIDRDERTYFHLFPAVRGFDRASTFRRSTGDIAVVITRRDTTGAVRETTVTVGAEAAGQLAVFVDSYERIRSGTQYFDFRPIKDYAGLPTVSCTTTRPLRITLNDGAEYVAQILHAADSVLVLWTGDGVYDWQTVGENAAFMPYHTIRAVIYKENARFRRAMTCGLGGCLIGGVAGAAMGLAAGDDPEDQWLVSNTAEQKALIGGLGCGLFGGAVGALFGVMGGAGESRLILGSSQSYQYARPSLNQRAVFPYRIPPEISHLLENTYSPTEQ